MAEGVDAKTPVFIAWGGERSKAIGTALHGWLRMVIQSAEPWMSEHDIDGGARWSPALARALESSSFGLVCLTPENLTNVYLHFEAGAIAKVVDQARLMPYLLDLKNTQVKGPLADFQMSEANEEGTLKVVRALNTHANPRPLKDSDLKDLFKAMWPALEKQIEAARSLSGAKVAPRPMEDMIKEILERVREMERRAGLSPETRKVLKEIVEQRLAAQSAGTFQLNRGDSTFSPADLLPGQSPGPIAKIMENYAQMQAETSRMAREYMKASQPSTNAIRQIVEDQARMQAEVTAMTQGLHLTASPPAKDPKRKESGEKKSKG